MIYRAIGLSVTGDVIAAISNRRITIWGLVLVGEVATTAIVLRSGTTGAFHLGTDTDPYVVGINPLVMPIGSRPWVQCDDATSLRATITGRVSGLIAFTREDQDITLI